MNEAATIKRRNSGNHMPKSKLMPPQAKRAHIQGLIDAPIALVEYGDYEGPCCGAASPIVKAIQVRLGNRRCFAFRNLSLVNAHPYAQHAAESAEAAAQGRRGNPHPAGARDSGTAGEGLFLQGDREQPRHQHEHRALALETHLRKIARPVPQGRRAEILWTAVTPGAGRAERQNWCAREDLNL
jgi:hypothetical protein